MVEKVSHLKIRESRIANHRKELQRALNKIVGKRELYFLKHVSVRNDASLAHMILPNPATKSTISDLGVNEVIAQLANSSKKDLSLWFGLYESWQKHKKAKLLFREVSLHFYLQMGIDGAEAITKQIFRLEWLGRHFDESDQYFQTHGAAHPHWQFDQWLTSSDEESLNRIKAELKKDSREPRAFTEAELEQKSPTDQIGGRPDLKWFTKIHFPAIALWHSSRIESLNDPILPHAHGPESTEQIENWTYSSLLYIKDQFQRYCP